MQNKSKTINTYGDSDISYSNGHGCDISSQRFDELDEAAYSYAKMMYQQNTPAICADLGCGHGSFGLKVSPLCQQTHLFDIISPSDDIKEAINNRANRLNYYQTDLRSFDFSAFPLFSLVYSQRFIHYLSFQEASNLIKKISDNMLVNGMLFISASGIKSELGDEYEGRDTILSERFFYLTKKAQTKHKVLSKVCLYSEYDLIDLVTPFGFKAVRVYSSDFGNIKGFFSKT